MANHDAKKKKLQTRIAGAAFGCALVAVCVALFLFSDSGAAFLASAGITNTVHEPAPDLTATPDASAPAGQNADGANAGVPFGTEDFWELAGSLDAPAGTPLRPSGTEGRAAVYSIANEYGVEATLTLSLQNGTVTALTLSMEPLEALLPLPADAGPIQQKMYEEKKAQNEARAAWFSEAFLCYCLSLDHTQSLAYAEVDSIADEVHAAIKESGACSGQAGGFEMDAALTAEGIYAATFRAKS